MSAGDLGLESSEVESSLSNVLEMTSKWNAVLLLDEADVFLEQRSAHDLERNKLVSSECLVIKVSRSILMNSAVFLRMLEYYEGILFLTTNRVDNIDAAFQSLNGVRGALHFFPPSRLVEFPIYRGHKGSRLFGHRS